MIFLFYICKFRNNGISLINSHLKELFVVALELSGCAFIILTILINKEYKRLLGEVDQNGQAVIPFFFVFLH